jgi:hypothetical protein
MPKLRLGPLLLLASLAGAAVLPSFPLDDPATALLDRLEGRSGCLLPPRRPWPGEVVLACVDSLLESPSTEASDKIRLLALRRRLALRDSAGLDRSLTWRTGQDLASFDIGASVYSHSIDRRVAVGAALGDSIDGDNLLGFRLRPRVDVLLGDDLLLWSRPRQLVELSTDRRWVKTADPKNGIYQTALFAKFGELGSARTNDWIEGGIEFQTRLGRVFMGLTPLEWGDLPIEPLMLSGNTESVPLAQITKTIGPIEATLMGGRLIGDTWDERRYMYAHRFAWNGKNWRVGWTEMILSIERDVEPLYLVPVFPYVFTEHYLGDPDNKQMNFDASWRPTPGLELSGELFLDDLQNYLGFLSDGWGNKWALGLGVKLSGWTGKGSLDKIQITRTEPWVGTASSSIQPGQPSNEPFHFGSPLGSSAGPNSLAIVLRHSQDLSAEWTWNAGLSSLHNGTDFGSSMHDRNWRDSSGTSVVAVPTKEWLSDTTYIRVRQEVTLGFEWRFRPGWRWQASTSVVFASNPQWIPSIHPGFSTAIAFHE